MNLKNMLSERNQTQKVDVGDKGPMTRVSLNRVGQETLGS